MQRSEKILQGAYALSIAILSSFIIESIAGYAHLKNPFFFLKSIGVVLLIIGLFKFQKGLRAGLVLAGFLLIWPWDDNNPLFLVALAIGFIILMTLNLDSPQTKGLFPFNMDDSLLFGLTLVMLVITGYGLYRLRVKRKENKLEKNMGSSLQERLIAIALVILIPATTLFGLRVISPKIEWLGLRIVSTELESKKYPSSYIVLTKGFPGAKSDRWEQTEMPNYHSYKVGVEEYTALMICGVLSIILFYIGSTLAIPLIAASFILSGLILQLFSRTRHLILFGTPTLLIKILFALIGLLIVLWAARRDSRD